MTKAVQDLMVAVAKVRDDYRAAVLRGDVAAAVALATDDVVLETLPSGSGAHGREELHRHLADVVLPHLPDDLSFRRVSRTVDRWRVADEEVVGLTHDRPLPWLLPGVPPTGRHAEVLVMSVVTVDHGRIRRHRSLWDHAALVARLGR